MSSDTPRTDAASFDLTWRNGAYYVSIPNVNHATVVSAELARQLERELNAARDTVNNLADENAELGENISELKAHLALAREELQKERARLDWLETQDVWIGVSGEYDLKARIYAGGGYSQRVRDAIDAAMKEDAK